MMKKIFESTLILGISSILVMGLDMVRIKILATMLGPSGVGTLSILAHFHSLAAVLVGLGMGTGITKYVATARSNHDILASTRIFADTFKLLLVGSLITVTVILFTAPLLSSIMLGTTEYARLIRLYAISLPLGVFATTSAAFMQGLKRIADLARINVSRVLLTLVFVVPLVYWFGLTGAAISVIVGTAIQCVLNSWFIRKEQEPRGLWSLAPLHGETIRKQFQYGITSLLTAGYSYLMQLLLKMLIVARLGLHANGIYQPIWALTMSYPTIVLSSMSGYSYPRLCELHERREIVEELNGILRIAVLLIVPVMFFLLVFRNLVVSLLYDSSFLAATIYMPVQIIGDFFKVVNWSMGMFLLPMKHLKFFFFINALQDTLLMLFALLFINHFHLAGVTAAFALCHIVAFVVLLTYAVAKIGFRLWPSNIVLLSVSLTALLVLIAGLQMHSGVFKGMVIAGIALLWGLFSVKRNEVISLMRYARTLFLARFPLRPKG